MGPSVPIANDTTIGSSNALLIDWYAFLETALFGASAGKFDASFRYDSFLPFCGPVLKLFNRCCILVVFPSIISEAFTLASPTFPAEKYLTNALPLYSASTGNPLARTTGLGFNRSISDTSWVIAA